MAIYTQLSPIATPGKRYSFSEKTPVAEKGVGLFTALSVLALPGPIHTFLAKASVTPEPEPTPTPSISVGGGGGLGLQFYAERERLARLRRDDNDLLEIISAMLTKGMLN